MPCAECRILFSIMVSHYVECRYAECRGAVELCRYLMLHLPLATAIIYTRKKFMRFVPEVLMSPPRIDKRFCVLAAL
jgi:hypothetical protein